MGASDRRDRIHIYLETRFGRQLTSLHLMAAIISPRLKIRSRFCAGCLASPLIRNLSSFIFPSFNGPLFHGPFVATAFVVLSAEHFVCGKVPEGDRAFVAAIMLVAENTERCGVKQKMLRLSRG